MYSSMSDPQVARSIARMRTEDQVRSANARRTSRAMREAKSQVSVPSTRPSRRGWRSWRHPVRRRVFGQEAA